MKWTVSRRIVTGFAIALSLLVVIAAIALWALGRTVGSPGTELEFAL